MIFFCNGCATEQDFKECRLWVCVDKEPIKRYCRNCKSGTPLVADVYWDGKPEINLADDPVTGKPRVFASKGQKAAYLKERGLMEAGDRLHGAPVEMARLSRKTDSRHEVKMAIKQVKEMGQDVRRQAYLKILKERRP